MKTLNQQMFDLVENKQWMQLQNFLRDNHNHVTSSALETSLFVCAKHGMDLGVQCLIPHCDSHALYEAANEAWAGGFSRTFGLLCPHLHGHQHTQMSINIARLKYYKSLKILINSAPKSGTRSFESAMWFALSSTTPNPMVDWLLPHTNLDTLKHNIDNVNRAFVLSEKFDEQQGFDALQSLLNQRQNQRIVEQLGQHTRTNTPARKL